MSSRKNNVIEMPKPKAEAPAASEPRPITAVVDEYGFVDEQYKIFEKRRKALREQILAQRPNLAANATSIVSGDRYDVQIGAHKRERAVGKLKDLLKLVGALRFWKMVRVSVTDLEKELPADQAAPFITETHSGGRTLTPVRKFPAPSVKEAA